MADEQPKVEPVNSIIEMGLHRHPLAMVLLVPHRRQV